MIGKRVLTGCLAALVGLAISGGSGAAEPPGFGPYLAQGYREIALFALNRLADPVIAAHFASRAEMTDLAGATVDPEAVDSWKLDGKQALEARAARRKLMDRLAQDARWSSPLTSAIAVLNFDCWLGFAAADPASSGECRRRFLAALQALPAEPAPSGLAPAGTATLIALAACAAPPWLGDCPTPRDGGKAPEPGSAGERHAAAGETGTAGLSALAVPPAGISALAGAAEPDSLPAD